MAEVDDIKPRMLMAEDRELLLEVDLDSIAQYFTCSLCTGLFREPYTIPECLHTFCKSCLVIHLRKNAACPECKCNTTISAIKLDRNIDALFQKLFPEVQKQDEELEKQWYKDNNIPMPEKPSFHHVTGSSSSSNKGIKRTTSGSQAGPIPKRDETKKLKGEEQSPSASTTAGPSGTANPTTAAGAPRQPPVKIKLTLQPEDPSRRLDKPYIEANGGVKVAAMRGYIADKFQIPKEKVVLLCSNEILAPDHTTEFIQRTKWKDPSMNMVWTFRILGT